MSRFEQPDLERVAVQSIILLVNDIEESIIHTLSMVVVGFHSVLLAGESEIIVEYVLIYS